MNINYLQKYKADRNIASAYSKSIWGSFCRISFRMPTSVCFILPLINCKILIANQARLINIGSATLQISAV